MSAQGEPVLFVLRRVKQSLNEVNEWHVSLSKLWVLDHGKAGPRDFQSSQQEDQHFELPSASGRDGSQDRDASPRILISSPEKILEKIFKALEDDNFQNNCFLGSFTNFTSFNKLENSPVLQKFKQHFTASNGIFLFLNFINTHQLI